MNIVQFSIRNPVTVLVGVILLLLFGTIALFGLPYQLSPSVTEPEITVRTNWPGATPYEVERDIIEEQEDVLKGIPNLIEMESESFNGFGQLTLRFEIGTDVGEALLRVSNKLNEVPSYPDTANQPVINATGAATSPVIWMLLRSDEGNPRPVRTYLTFFENEVRQYLERVEGVADIFVGGGTETEMHIVVDPERLAAYNLTIPMLADVLARENVNVSAGTMGLGRRDYRIRTVAQFQSPEEIEDIIVTSSGQRRIRVRDVAEVRFGYEKEAAAILHNGQEAIALGVKPEPGTNVLDLTDRAEEVVRWINENKLKDQGVHIEWVYDQRSYIRGAIDLVQQNILIGGVLAVVVLLVFLQSATATLIVATAIPISIVGAFIFMGLLGRTLNVVSMAGISFAVGMLVDNAIVVLENIDRHRSMDKGPFRAAYDGTTEVIGAVIASTLTSVAVFLPVVFVEEEAGQLFKDISIAVTCAIILSMFVSMTVIPMMANRLYRLSKGGRKKPAKFFSGVRRLGTRGVEAVMGLVSLALGSVLSRVVTVVLLTGLAVAITWGFFPKMEYLPQGNRNLILNILIPPPGLSLEERQDIGRRIFSELEPHFQGPVGPFPQIRDSFYVSAPSINIMGVISGDESRGGALIPLFMKTINSIPGVFGVSLQASIFEQRLGGGRSIDVDLSGPDLPAIIRAGGTMFGMISQMVPGAQVRPIPSLEMLYPEVNLEPQRDRVRAAGLSSRDLGVSLDVLMDGRKIGEFKQEGQKTIDMVLTASQKRVSTPEELFSALLATPTGATVPVSSLANLERTMGITQVRHLERQRTVTLQVTPPPEMPLQSAMETIQDRILPQVREQGLLQDITVRLSGAADKLSVTRDALKWNFILAVAITYLLMSALFGNFIYPLIIMFTVPLAAAGGFLGLKLENWFIAPQPLDVLTMLGFIILIGVVVNNAILIVYQALNNLRDHGMARKEAVLESVRTRLRPIYMSASTSVFGMLPLAIAPGPGSELYRGLGSVVLGGLALSTVFTVFVIPALLMFFLRMESSPAEE